MYACNGNTISYHIQNAMAIQWHFIKTLHYSSDVEQVFTVTLHHLSEELCFDSFITPLYQAYGSRINKTVMAINASLAYSYPA